MTATSTTTATPTLTPANLPPIKIAFLNQDGTVSLPWFRFFQSLKGQDGTLAQTTGSLGQSVDSNTSDVAQALADAQAALDASDIGALLGMIERPAVSSALTLGDLLAFSAVRQTRRLSVTDGGTLVVSDLHVIDFEGAGVTVAASPNKATVTIPGGGGGGGGGFLPLVNGTKPFLGLIHTPDGQCVGVPQG